MRVFQRKTDKRPDGKREPRHAAEPDAERPADRETVEREPAAREPAAREPAADEPTAREPVAGRGAAAEPEVVEEEHDAGGFRWTPASLIVVVAGAALAVIGLVALIRTGIDSTWYSPTTEVANISHTPLLAAIEVGVGALLVIFALTGVRVLTTLVLVIAAIGALVAAIDPGQFSNSLAIERGWAIALAVAAAVLVILTMLPSPIAGERQHRVVRRHRYGAA